MQVLCHKGAKGTKDTDVAEPNCTLAALVPDPFPNFVRRGALSFFSTLEVVRAEGPSRRTARSDQVLAAGHTSSLPAKGDVSGKRTLGAGPLALHPSYRGRAIHLPSRAPVVDRFPYRRKLLPGSPLVLSKAERQGSGRGPHFIAPG